jgi:hypothetical protein
MSLTILSKLKEGNAPLTVRQSAARGVLPVGQEELLGILVYLQAYVPLFQKMVVQ